MDTGPAPPHRLRPRMMAVAYRMLGSVTDAEDVVQDAFVRLQTADGVTSHEGFLIRTTTRLCIDHLRRAKRREGYVGQWLPEPVAGGRGVGADADLAESLSMAFLVLLETLNPDERAAFLLREVFGYEYDEIGELLDKTPANVRQIAARARRRLDLKERRFTTPPAEADELAARFIAACRSGDVSEIESMLAGDAVLHADGGGKVHASPRPVAGAPKIANLLATVFRKRMQDCELSLTTVNGQPGVVFSRDGRAVQVHGFASEGGAITRVFIVLSPDKLSRWPTPAATSAPEKERTDGAPTELPDAGL